MTQFKSNFLNILNERGFIHQLSDPQGLDDLFLKQMVPAYIGFDPTATSLHVGSLIQIMMLYWLQQTGHKPVVVMGGGTGLVGDPSFKNETRKLINSETIQKNISEIKNVFSNYLDFSEKKNSAIIVNNAEWLCDLNYLEFLRDVGRHFSVNRMLSFDSVKLRLEQKISLSFLEFNYMLLQAYDFVQLNKRHGVCLQMGGSDQWGNIVNGIELGHRMETDPLYALTSPLLTTSSGDKMGKTLKGSIWLNSNLLSPYEFWQFWRNTQDLDVGRFLKLYTTLPLSEIGRLEKLQGAELNVAKKILATEVTTLLHGKEAAEAAAETARKTFEEILIGDDLPTIYLNPETVKNGIGVLTLLQLTKLTNSNSEGRRNIRGRSIKINNRLVDDESLVLNDASFEENGLKISFGKKKHILVKC